MAQIKSALIIGAAFGFSSAIIAQAIAANGGTLLVTIDSNYQDAYETVWEGIKLGEAGDRQRDCRENLRTLLNLPLTWINIEGVSPTIVPFACGGCIFDLIFIDASHTEDAVRNDYKIMQTFTHRNTLIAFHDYIQVNAFIKTLPDVCIFQSTPHKDLFNLAIQIPIIQLREDIFHTIEGTTWR